MSVGSYYFTMRKCKYSTFDLFSVNTWIHEDVPSLFDLIDSLLLWRFTFVLNALLQLFNYTIIIHLPKSLSLFKFLLHKYTVLTFSRVPRFLFYSFLNSQLFYSFNLATSYTHFHMEFQPWIFYYFQFWVATLKLIINFIICEWMIHLNYLPIVNAFTTITWYLNA